MADLTSLLKKIHYSSLTKKIDLKCRIEALQDAVEPASKILVT
jgi:hypothetical protein